MAGIRDEIKQTRPFRSMEDEVLVGLLRTADVVQRRALSVLKDRDLTLNQYNVLRILRGAGAEGLPCREIGGRMISHDPDLTRLLDRLEKRGLVVRSREARDRRVVTSRITPAGLALLAELDAPAEESARRTLAHLGKAELKTLAALLDRVRSA